MTQKTHASTRYHQHETSRHTATALQSSRQNNPYELAAFSVEGPLTYKKFQEFEIRHLHHKNANQTPNPMLTPRDDNLNN